MSKPEGFYVVGTGSRSLKLEHGVNFVGLSNSEFSTVCSFFPSSHHVDRDSPDTCDLESAQNYPTPGGMVDFLSLEMPANGKKLRMESTVITGGRNGLLNGKAQDAAAAAIRGSMNRAVSAEAGFANFISNIVNPLDNVSVTPPLGQTLSANVRSQVTVEFSALFDSTVATANRYIGYLSIGQLQAMCAILGTQGGGLYVLSSYTPGAGGLVLNNYWEKSITPIDGIPAGYVVNTNPTTVPLALSSAYDTNGTNLKLLCTIRNGNTLVSNFGSGPTGSSLKSAGSYNVCFPLVGLAAGGDFCRISGSLIFNASATRVLTLSISYSSVDKTGTATTTTTILASVSATGVPQVVPFLGFTTMPNGAVGLASATLSFSLSIGTGDVGFESVTLAVGCSAAAWQPSTPFGNWQLVASPNRPTVASTSTSASAYSPWAGATLGTNATSQFSIAGSILVAQFGANVDLGDFIGMEPKTLGSVPGVQSVPASQGFYSVDNYLPTYIAGVKFGIDEQPNFAMPSTLMLAELPAPGSAGGNYYYRFAAAQFHLVPTINQGLKPETASLDMDWVEAAQEALQPPILTENPVHTFEVSNRIKNAVYRLINNRRASVPVTDSIMLRTLTRSDQRAANAKAKSKANKKAAKLNASAPAFVPGGLPTFGTPIPMRPANYRQREEVSTDED